MDVDTFHYISEISTLETRRVFVLRMVFGLITLHTSALVFLLIACIRFRASDSLIEVLGKDLVKEVKTLGMLHVELKTAILDCHF